MSQNGTGAGHTILKYWPILVVAAGALASGAVAQYQIGDHAERFKTISVELGNRVTHGVYNRRVDTLDRDYAELEDKVEKNADAISELIRSNDATNAQLNLEMERIRREIERANAAQAQGLEDILKVLQDEVGRRRDD